MSARRHFSCSMHVYGARTAYLVEYRKKSRRRAQMMLHEQQQTEPTTEARNVDVYHVSAINCIHVDSWQWHSLSDPILIK